MADTRGTDEFPQFVDRGSHFYVYRSPDFPETCLKILNSDELKPEIQEIIKLKILALKTVSDLLEQSNVFIPGFPRIFEVINTPNFFAYKTYFAEQNFSDYTQSETVRSGGRSSEHICDTATTYDLIYEIFGIENYDYKHDNVGIYLHSDPFIGEQFMITDWSGIFLNEERNQFGLSNLGPPFSNSKIREDAFKNSHNYRYAVAKSILEVSQTLLPTNQPLLPNVISIEAPPTERYFNLLFDSIEDKDLIKRRLIHLANINRIQTNNLSLDPSHNYRLKIKRTIINYFNDCIALFD